MSDRAAARLDTAGSGIDVVDRNDDGAASEHSASRGGSQGNSPRRGEGAPALAMTSSAGRTQTGKHGGAPSPAEGAAASRKAARRDEVGLEMVDVDAGSAFEAGASSDEGEEVGLVRGGRGAFRAGSGRAHRGSARRVAVGPLATDGGGGRCLWCCKLCSTTFRGEAGRAARQRAMAAVVALCLVGVVVAGAATAHYVATRPDPPKPPAPLTFIARSCGTLRHPAPIPDDHASNGDGGVDTSVSDADDGSDSNSGVWYDDDLVARAAGQYAVPDNVTDEIAGVLRSQLWPLPRSVWAEQSDSRAPVLVLSPVFEFRLMPILDSGGNESSWPEVQTGAERSRLLSAMDRTCGSLLAAGPELPLNAGQMIHAIEVTVTSSDGEGGLPPKFGVNESYSLLLEAPVAKLVAPTVWGALHGLETLSQTVSPRGAIYGGRVRIVDEPRFPWRGFMIDTARHFLPVPTILRIVDGLAMNKLNTLHWHIMDAQSFPLHLDSHPELAQHGAFGPDKVYAESDVAEIVEYAADRGVRVVPEVDVPAHTASWGKGAPEAIVHCDWLASGSDKANDKYALRTYTNYTLSLVADVIAEVASMFPDEVLHIGGDEVDAQCWMADDGVREYLAAHPEVNGATGLMEQFERAVADMVLAAGKQPMAWQGVYDAVGESGMPSAVSIEPWKCWGGLGDSALVNAANAGRGVVQSMCWYLDWDSRWWDYYGHDPLPSDAWRREQLEDGGGAPQVWGGEVTLFAENVDWTNWDCRAWPRGAAAAERFWSPSDVRDPESALPRLRAHAQRMSERGIGVAPLEGPFSDEGKAFKMLCPKIAQASQRPAPSAPHKFIQYNVDHGGGTHQDELLEWLRGRNANVVGVSEANTWGSPMPDAPPPPTEWTPSGMAARASIAGFPFAVLFQTQSGYNIGMLSTWPIKVISADDTNFERGMLEARTNGVTYLLVHLHAHDSIVREAEAEIVANRVKHHTAAGHPVLVAGDMNTLSPLDRAWHEQEDLLGFINDPRVPSRLRAKYLDAEGNLNYRPMEILLGSGLQDLCSVTSWPGDAAVNATDPALERLAPSPCLYTEPTSIPMVQGAAENGVETPPFRLDYGLANVVFAGRVARPMSAQCAVVQTDETYVMSDHYPVECRWEHGDAGAS